VTWMAKTWWFKWYGCFSSGGEQTGDDGDVSMEQRRCITHQTQEGFVMEWRHWIHCNHKNTSDGICGLFLLVGISIWRWSSCTCMGAIMVLFDHYFHVLFSGQLVHENMCEWVCYCDVSCEKLFWLAHTYVVYSKL
jgi:hypothetical protein